MTLQTRIFVGLVAGIAVGALAKIPGAGGFQRAVLAAEPVGTIFIRLVTMTVIPLVVATLFTGVASLGDVRRLGRIGGKTLAYFLATTVLAATIGLAVAMVAGLGAGVEPSVREALMGRGAVEGVGGSGAAGGAAAQAAVAAQGAKVPGFVESLVQMIPQNPVASAAQGDLLPLIVAVCLFGAAAGGLRGDGKRALVTFFEGVNEVAMVVVRWLMWLAPAAVFVLVAATVARSGLDLLANLFAYAMVVVAAMAVHAGAVLLPALRFGAGLGVAAFARAVSDALLLAFSTASSNVTLPVSMAAARTRLGLPAEIVSFVLPAGVTLNKNGAAVYKAVTAVFLAGLYGVPLGAATMLTIVLTTTVASAAGAGVPGSSLVTTLIVLNAIGLGPSAAAGIALVTAVDRPLDMVRTAMNTCSNLVGAAVVARSEGQLQRSELPAFS